MVFMVNSFVGSLDIAKKVVRKDLIFSTLFVDLSQRDNLVCFRSSVHKTGLITSKIFLLAAANGILGMLLPLSTPPVAVL